MSLFDFIPDEELRQKAEETFNSQIKEIEESFQEKIKEKLDEEVAGLKAKNEELIAEKRKIQEMLKNFEGLDPEKAKEALQFLENNEAAQLIKEGKIDELIEKKTSAIRSEYEKKLEELNAQLQEYSTKAETYENMYKTKMIEDSLREAAIKANVRPEAIPDILLRGRMIFSLAEDGTLEARNEKGRLVKTDDGKVLTPSVWMEELKKQAPHYWPPSEGAGAHGTKGSESDLEAALARAAAKGDMKEYRRLRAKMAGG